MKIISPSYRFENPSETVGMLHLLERAGRTCYKSEEKITEESAIKFVTMLLARGHESVLEHEKVTVRVICDRGVTHEIVRHRLGSYSQESTRYCNYGHEGEITVILPLWYQGAHEELRDAYPIATDDFHRYPLTHIRYLRWRNACEVTERMYLELLFLKAQPQEARAVLPNSLKTEIVITYNLREWRHFFKLRTAKAAHPQMREITIPMLRDFKRLIPVIFDDITPEVGS